MTSECYYFLPSIVSIHGHPNFTGESFGVLINDELVVVLSSREWTLNVALKEQLRDIPLSSCKFYRMRNPVPVGDSTELDDMPLVQACAVKDNRIPIHPMKMKVGDLEPELFCSYIYVVVDIAGGQYNQSFSVLARRLTTLQFPENVPRKRFSPTPTPDREDATQPHVNDTTSRDVERRRGVMPASLFLSLTHPTHQTSSTRQRTASKRRGDDAFDSTTATLGDSDVTVSTDDNDHDDSAMWTEDDDATSR